MIHLELELAEVNGVLSALGKFPFEQVADLVAKIRDQAIPQVPEEAEEDAGELLEELDETEE
jgi:hypothetical protein